VQDITFQRESWTKCVEELKQYFPQHYKELAVESAEILPRVMWWERYQIAEQNGSLFLMTIRDSGKLIGYFIGVVGPHMHYATTLHYFSDLYYFDHEYRGKGIASRGFEALEIELRKIGVKKMMFNTKVHENHSAYFEKNGCKMSDYTFTKILEGKN
jgi:L-amino acid N-acyltransferase YncA